jgi:hypothetical protein
VGADGGPPKVNFWEKPTEVEAWKEEHVCACALSPFARQTPQQDSAFDEEETDALGLRLIWLVDVCRLSW